MQFNPICLDTKLRHLDAILAEPEVLQRVLARCTSGQPATVAHQRRPWEPGGGSTLFTVRVGIQSYFLKVKKLAVTVESRLESEASFSVVPSLRNEFQMLQRVKDLGPNTPQSFQYFEEAGYGFLFLEPLTSFTAAAGQLEAEEWVAAYDQIEKLLRAMHSRGLVHTDVHELNLMFRGKTPVVVDFEEARELAQDVPFESSLDYIGENTFGNVGEMPAGPDRVPGLTCLKRLREVFKQRVRASLEPLIRQCNFDSSCPFLAALDHGRDNRIYQSIDLDGIQVAGQRPLTDTRIQQVLGVIQRHFDHPITHLDIGSNLGRFNLELTRSDAVASSYGVEAFEPYVRLARVLAFLADNTRAHFLCAECGNDRLAELVNGQKVDCITIYSVYHHIRNKTAFLEDIRRLDPELILLEMPVQRECYQGRTWQQEMDQFCAGLGRPGWELASHSADFQRPILVVKKAKAATSPQPLAAAATAAPARDTAQAAREVLRANPWYTSSQFAWAEQPFIRPIYERRREFLVACLQRQRQRIGRGQLRVLDAGCGDGYWLKFLSEMPGIQAVGVDYNELRVQRVRQVIPNCEVVVSSLQDFHSSQPFDLIWCSQVIEHIADDEGLLRHLRGLLTPDGALILGTPNEGSPGHQLTLKESGAIHGTDHCHFYSEAEVRRKLASCGFGVNEVLREVFFLGNSERVYRLTEQDWGCALLEFLSFLLPGECSDYYFECRPAPALPASSVPEFRLPAPETKAIQEQLQQLAERVLCTAKAKPVALAPAALPPARPSAPASPKPMARPSPQSVQAGPRVSIVLPTYNHLQFLPQAIQSVLEQTYTDFELIIVNDGSTDGTRDFLDRIKNPRIRVIHQENQRLPRALNAGFNAARGELLTWISADNYCAPIFLEAMVGAFDAHPEAGLVVSAFAWLDSEGRITGVRRDQDLSLPSLLRANPAIAAFLYRRSCREIVGDYEPAIEGAEDWDMWIRLIERFPVVYVPEILYYYRLHEDSMTRRIPDRIRQASTQVVLRALERCQQQLDLDALYPAIATCADRAQAEAEACFDFGTSMLLSPFAPPHLAPMFLNAAFEKSPRVEVLFNLTFALAKAGQWNDVAACLAHLKAADQPQIQRALPQLEAAISVQKPELLQEHFVFTLPGNSMLLAETHRSRLVYSLTADTAVGSSTPPESPDKPSAPTPTAPPATPPAAAPANTDAPAPAQAVQTAKPLRIVALLAAYNEGDVIYHVIGDLVKSGVEVYFIDNNSTDNTVAEAGRWLGKGLIHIERFPQDSGFPAVDGQEYVWRDILQRKEQLAASLGADWYLHTDADEFRESPWPGLNLAEAIQRVDQLGYSAINFELLNFRPTDNSFVPGSDVREHLLYCEGAKPFDAVQLKAWKNPGKPVDLASTGGHCVRFAGRRIFPTRFLLRHYPIRSEAHGRQKVFRDRQNRFNAAERKLGWHVQYDEFLAGKSEFLHDPASLIRYDGQAVRQQLLADAAVGQSSDSASQAPGLTSILILALNQLEHTRACLDSIEAHTPQPHEVIIVDNGSTDGTPEYLRQWQGAGENRIVIRNQSNRGFAAGNNQALSLAKGQTVVLLNNDTIVTEGWLSSLLAPFKLHPQVGMVGPMSNNISGPQCVREATYKTVAELPEFAAEWALLHRGQSVPVSRAVGFCLAMSRPLVERIGGLDERFGLGNFEDDDLCIRAHLAGFEARVALDSFVHHVGSQTFKSAGINFQQAMKRNWGIFSAKWGLPSAISPDKGYAFPQHLPPKVSLRVPLPMLSLTHQADSQAPNLWSEILLSKPKAAAELPAIAHLGNLDAARAHLGNNQLPAAWTATVEALQLRPFHPEAWLLLARIAAQAGDAAMARQCAQHARDLAPGWKAIKQFLQKPPKGNQHPEWAVLPSTTGAKATDGRPALRLSVCVIAKNEERFIEQCLKSVKPLAWQIVLVDTGSTDRTVEIAKSLGAEVHTFAWCDDFSAARNAALEHARGDFILMLDADEELPADQHARLLADLANSKAVGWRLPLVNCGKESEGRSFVPRLFTNAPGVYFKGRIHEQVFPSLLAVSTPWGLNTVLGTGQLLHHGYTQELVEDRKKIERNLALLRQAVQEQPDDANLVMNLGLELVRSGELAAGLSFYREAFRLMGAQDPSQVVPELREVLLTQMTAQLYKIQAYQEVLDILESALAANGGLTASLHFALGLAHFELKQYREAADQMRQCLTKRTQPALTPINTDILTAAPQHCLALSLARSKQAKEAEQAFKAGLAESAQTPELALDYARFLVEQNQHIEAMQLLHQQVSANAMNLQAWLLGGQIALSRPDYLEFARDWTQEALKVLPAESAIIAQRAEALLLNQDPAAAKPFFKQLYTAENQARWLAGLILCEALDGNVTHTPQTPAETAATNQEFLNWYRRCLAAGTRDLIVRLNEQSAALQTALPETAQILQAVAAQAAEEATPELVTT